ncbi:MULTISPECIES: hypothetical protein [Campylobacter]|uniref:hypothetical protein n=1 Tax=Campylobacter TaxID=194 RepID=UPI00031DD83F|nr:MULTISPECIES: hypothetical protein [Campylobacter]
MKRGKSPVCKLILLYYRDAGWGCFDILTKTACGNDDLIKLYVFSGENLAAKRACNKRKC